MVSLGAAIDVNRFAGDAGARVGKQKCSGRADFAGIHVAFQRRALGVRFQHVAQTGNASRRQGFDRPGGDGVHANGFRPEIVGEVAHARLQRGFGDAHHVVSWHDLFRAVISEGDDSAA